MVVQEGLCQVTFELRGMKLCLNTLSLKFLLVIEMEISSRLQVIPGAKERSQS